MKKIILLITVMLAPVSHAVDLHMGLNGPWHDPLYDGQGMVVHVIPEQNLVFVAWFTYQVEGGQQQWLTAYGGLSDEIIQLDVLSSKNGQFNGAEPLPEQISWGTAQLKFLSCGKAEFRFAGPTEGRFDLVRLTPALNCEDS